jgi:hypothetical protein
MLIHKIIHTHTCSYTRSYIIIHTHTQGHTYSDYGHNTQTRACLHVHIYTQMRTLCMYKQMLIQMNNCATHTHIHIPIHKHKHTYAPAHTYISIYTCTHTHANTYTQRTGPLDLSQLFHPGPFLNALRQLTSRSTKVGC